MGSLSIFDSLAFGFSAFAYIPYVRYILNSKTRPTMSSWICWFLMDIFLFFGMLSNGAFSWQLVAYISGCVVVLGISVWRRATLGWGAFDTICLTIVGLALVLWTITGDATEAIVIGLIAAIVGSFPLFYNLWKDPTVEAPPPWVLCSIGSAFQLLAIEEWGITQAATPLAYLGVQLLALTLISRKYFRFRSR